MTESTTAQAGERSFASSRTYSGVASQLGIALCGDGWPRNRIGNHEAGWTAYGMTIIHWNERRVTKRGLLRFLKLVAKAQMESAHQGERFVVLYWQNVEAYRLARLIGIRLPRSLADPDRAKARLWLARFRNNPLDREFPEQRDLMRRIRRWSRS